MSDTTVADEVNEITEEELNELMEEMSRQYDEILQRETEENPPEIGYCGFPCDGRCPTCIDSGAGGFDMSDEV
jgi:hypothetical protein